MQVEKQSGKIRFRARRWLISEETFRLQDGRLHRHFTLRHPGAVLILPVTEAGELVLLEQYRYSLGGKILEFPAGTMEYGEEPLGCAKRELAEETGYAAAEWIALGTLFPAPGFCDEVQHAFLAKGLSPAPSQPDPGEIIESSRWTASRVEEAIASGDLRDSKSISLYFKAKLSGRLS